MMSRLSAEIATAVFTAVVGVIVVAGALEYGIQWKSSGPEAGAFPFCVGLLIVLASAANLLQAFATRGHPKASFIDRAQAMCLLSFVGPMAAFIGVAPVLGLYVAMALYLFTVMRFQGHYGTLVSLAVALATAAFFFAVLEIGFQVPLLKGPVETWLGLH